MYGAGSRGQRLAKAMRVAWSTNDEEDDGRTIMDLKRRNSSLNNATVPLLKAPIRLRGHQKEVFIHVCKTRRKYRLRNVGISGLLSLSLLACCTDVVRAMTPYTMARFILRMHPPSLNQNRPRHTWMFCVIILPKASCGLVISYAANIESENLDAHHCRHRESDPTDAKGPKQRIRDVCERHEEL